MILKLVCFNNLYLRSQKIFKIHRFKKFLGQIKFLSLKNLYIDIKINFTLILLKLKLIKFNKI